MTSEPLSNIGRRVIRFVWTALCVRDISTRILLRSLLLLKLYSEPIDLSQRHTDKKPMHPTSTGETPAENYCRQRFAVNRSRLRNLDLFTLRDHAAIFGTRNASGTLVQPAELVIICTLTLLPAKSQTTARSGGVVKVSVTNTVNADDTGQNHRAHRHRSWATMSTRALVHTVRLCAMQ